MKRFRTFAVWFVLILVFVFAFQALRNQKDDLPFAPVQEFLDDLSQDSVAQVRIINDGLHVVLKDGMGEYLTEMPVHENFYDQLAAKDVPITSAVDYDEKPGLAASLVTTLLPIAIVVGFVYFLLRRSAKKGGLEILKLRDTPARQLDTAAAARFSDVGGCTDAKEQLGDIVDFLREPERWERLGARLPSGVLLEGPAGCGKTLLARAVAGEASVNFFTVGGSEFVEMFVGVGAARLRDTFETAAKSAPAIVFIDELDALGRRRGSGIGSGHDEREQTLNQLLMSLDGFHGRGRIVVIAATNRADILDKALLRPGRFDRRVKVPNPDRDARLEILRIHTRNRPLDDQIDLGALADATPAFSGADLENLANEAALLAARRCAANPDLSPTITDADMQKALAVCRSRNKRFTAVDAVLIESASQFMEPAGAAAVRLTLHDGAVVEGAIQWADSAFIKVCVNGDGQGVMVPKSRVAKVEALSGSDEASSEDIGLDMWHGRHPDMA